MRAELALFMLVAACGGTIGSSDAGSDAALDAVVKKDAGVDASVATITLVGTSVISPSGASLGQVNVCVFEHPEMPCTTSDASGAFSIALPMDAETGVTLTRTAYTSVLLPLETNDKDINGYIIGIPTASSRTTLYTAFSATYPDTVNGFVALYGTLQGQTELGLDGATGTITPQSGGGPFYVDASGNAAPSATSTSTVSEIFFANVAPATYVAQLAPLTLSCSEDFGGWTTSQLDATRFPVAAGFETHVGLVCSK